MSWRGTFDDALDAAIDAVRNGDPIDVVLARYPRHAIAMRPLLETALAANPAEAYVTPTARLAANFAQVASALGRVQWERDHSTTKPQASNPWWSKRVAFASLSLPAGILAFALLGAGGAAAATVVATTGLPRQVANKVESVTPSWTHGLIPGGSGDEPAGAAVSTPTTEAGEPPSPSSIPGASPAVTDTQPPVPSATPHGPQAITIDGVVSNVRGNTFELTASGVVYKVQIDENTAVTGILTAGAVASVAGDLTGTDRLHATSVAVSGDPATAPSPGAPPESSPEAPGQGDHTPPGPPEQTHTPPGQAQQTTTPPGQADKTKTPGPPATPPGQGGSNGNGGSGGNENGGGNPNN